MDILALLTGFGLSAAAGSRACLVLVALGLFHHTSYFELSPEFVWIGSPVVICVACVLALVEIAADAHPEVSELVHVASYLPKIVVGFVALAGSTGTVDRNLLLFAASGVVGGGTAAAVHYVRHKVRGVVHDCAGCVADHASPKLSCAETAGMCGVTAGAIFVPVLVVLVIALALVAGFFITRAMRARLEARLAAQSIPPEMSE